jgi:hypothetical protein
MITDEENSVRARALPLEIVRRNPLCLVLAKLRLSRLRKKGTLRFRFFQVSVIL